MAYSFQRLRLDARDDGMASYDYVGGGGGASCVSGVAAVDMQ